MAIIIPSKSIYGVENPKIRDNIIHSVETTASRVKPNNEYDGIVWDNSYYNGFYNIETKKGVETNTTTQNMEQYTYFNHDSAYYELTPKYFNLTTTINRVLKNSYIDSIKYGTYKDEASGKVEPNIKLTIHYTKITTPINWVVENGIKDGHFIKDLSLFKKENIIYKTNETKTEQINESSVEIKSYYNFDGNSRGGATVDLGIKNETNIDSKNIVTFSEDGNYIYLDTLICCGYESYSVGSTNWYESSNLPNGYEIATYGGNYIQAIPIKVDISVYGNTIGIDLEDIVNISGNGNNPFKQDSNELLQITNFIDKNKKLLVQPSKGNIGVNDNYVEKSITIVSFSIEEITSLKVGDVLYYESDSAEVVEVSQDIGKYIVKVARNGLFDKINEPIEVSVAGLMITKQQQKILQEYANGKETAVINCSISEYKDQDENIVINPKESEKMLFEMYDIVIPYKQGFVNGVQQDVPLSKYPNGEPKQFQVLGVKPHTRGVLRQELTLQEISQSTLQNK